MLSKVQFIAHSNFAGWIHQGIPHAHASVEFSQQKDFNHGPCFFFVPVHSGPEYLGIVEDQAIPFLEDFQNIPEFPVLDGLGLAVHHHHFGVIPVGQGLGGNEAGGQVELKFR